MANTQPIHGMPPLRTFIFAICGGAAVGNLYWAQPLLNEIAKTFSIQQAHVSFAVMMTQVGYALGALFVVPLGDAVNRSRLIPAVVISCGITLLFCSFSTNFDMLLVGLVAVGLTSISGQLLVPLANELALPHERGRVVGTVISGMLTGILASRTISGLVADYFGWRAIYLGAAVLDFGLALILIRQIPYEKRSLVLSYPDLLKSILQAVGQHRAIQITLAITAFTFSVFTMFWTGLTFLLSAPPFSYSLTQIGMAGLMGISGAMAARGVGKLHDSGLSTLGTELALILIVISLIIAWIAYNSIVLVLIAVFCFDVAIQTVNVLNQSRLFAIIPEARSRLNTAFIYTNFISGAMGSALVGYIWKIGGWDILIDYLLCFSLITLGIFLYGRKHLAIIDSLILGRKK